MRIAIFGGTFNPVHNAHVAIARLARERFSLDEVWLVPAAQPPHKPTAGAADFEHRYKMVELACQGEPGLIASRIEQENQRSFSILTMERIKRERPGDTFYFLIGADAFAEIKTWRRWNEVIAEVEFLVISRPDYQYEVPDGARVQRLDTARFEVSSTAIRERLHRGEAPGELHPAVLHYIRAHSLYKQANASAGSPRSCGTEPGHDRPEG
ncbi:MAG: nicotinate (nicotinamide) nucleotide adenylyltransferase [Acidimicrobiia bacterium]|nr:nicotinate (nicotinamide) nucleotide adenylyltransferase [Acidimicrobiia bacterium]